MITLLMISIGAIQLFNVTPGRAPISLNGLECVGTECHLTDCPQFPFGMIDCDSSEYVGVRCVSTPPRPGVTYLL